MHASTVVGWLLVVLGVAIVVIGKFGVGPEGADDADLRWIEGAPARWIGAGCTASGLCMTASPVIGFCMLLVVFAVTWTRR